MKSQPLNKASPKMDAFSPSRFIKDFEKTCEAIGAPFSKHETRAVLSAFSPEFHKGAILWRTTNKPGSGLKYRFNKRRSTDIIGIAKEAGLLEPDNRLAKLLKFWSEPWRGECELALPDLGCDFDTKHGLTKAWAYMGGLRPFGEIIDVDDAPVGVMRHEQIFKDLNLNFVRHIAVDFHSNTVDLYFRASDPLSKQRALNFVDLVGHSRISESDYAEMEQ